MIDTGRMIICFGCNPPRPYASRSGYRKHVRTIHKKRRYPCKFNCGKEYTCSTNTRVHEMTCSADAKNRENSTAESRKKRKSFEMYDSVSMSMTDFDSKYLNFSWIGNGMLMFLTSYIFFFFLLCDVFCTERLSLDKKSKDSMRAH